jgi:hypothetical protein
MKSYGGVEAYFINSKAWLYNLDKSTDSSGIVYHTEVPWLRRGYMFKRGLNLKVEMKVVIAERR